MNKKIIANRFGLIALISLSLFASTAFAGNTPAPTQVVVTNTPAQPVPMVGLVKDSDAPARKTFQWETTFTQQGQFSNGHPVTTIPANQRLVIEEVSAFCGGPVQLRLGESGPASHYQFLPASLASGYYIPALALIRFYADPGANLTLGVTNNDPSAYTCTVTLAGYFVDLP